MLTIAGGIILAVLFISLLPFLLAAAFYAIALGWPLVVAFFWWLMFPEQMPVIAASLLLFGGYYYYWCFSKKDA